MYRDTKCTVNVWIRGFTFLSIQYIVQEETNNIFF